MTPEQAKALAGSYYQDCKEPLAKSIANKETADYLTGRTASNSSAIISQDDESDKIEDEMDDVWTAGDERGRKDAAKGQPINYEGTCGTGSNPVTITPRMDAVEAAVRRNVRLRELQRAGRDRVLNNGADFGQTYSKSEYDHIPTWEEIRKSIANRDTAEYLHEKYKPYPGYISERRNEREGPHQPSIQSAIDALTSQQAEDERISAEREDVSDAGWDRGVRDAQAIIDQYKGKIPDEEIIKRLNALQSRSAPTDFRISDEGLSPDEQYMRAMNYAGYVENLDGKYNDFFAGDRTGGPNEDPVVSAVRNNVYHQESLRNNRDERLDMARSVGAGRRRSRFEHESEEEKKGEKEEE